MITKGAKEELQEVEGLVPFPDCLSDKDLVSWVMEEELRRDVLGYKRLFDDTYRKLKAALELRSRNPDKDKLDEEKIITDSYSYDLLS